MTEPLASSGTATRDWNQAFLSKGSMFKWSPWAPILGINEEGKMKSGNLRGRICFFAVIGAVALVSACTHKYVGRQVDVDTPFWCVSESLPASCTLGDESEAFLFDFTVSRGSVDGEYIVEGFMDGSAGALKSISTLVRGQCRFGLVLARDGVVIDYISFSPDELYLSRKIPFKKTFTSEPFDAISISYNVLANG